MTYRTPGNADALTQSALDSWNATVLKHYNDLAATRDSTYFSIDPEGLTDYELTNAVRWFADPAEPLSCLGRDYAKVLSDWSTRGRHALHNEYAEYKVIQRVDPNTGQSRNKRVQVTTELREYWVCVAKADPDAVRQMVHSALGFTPDWEELYGVADPFSLTPEQRGIAFSILVAGNGGDQALSGAGVPPQPTGRINTDNAIFMTHPINGLDDLIYIVLFGARPFAQRIAGRLKPATRNQIFQSHGVEYLACRHADPAAAMGAHAQVFQGKSLAFADPLGMYIASFTSEVFTYQGGAVPADWIRFSRGEDGMYQRLEFGPPDSDPAFLDDISVEIGGNNVPVTGGYQILEQMEVGPLVLLGPETELNEDDYVVLDVADTPINCRGGELCNDILRLKEEFDGAKSLVRSGPRRMEHRI